MTHEQAIEAIERMIWLANNGERPSKGELGDAEQAIKLLAPQPAEAVAVKRAEAARANYHKSVVGSRLVPGDRQSRKLGAMRAALTAALEE